MICWVLVQLEPINCVYSCFQNILEVYSGYSLAESFVINSNDVCRIDFFFVFRWKQFITIIITISYLLSFRDILMLCSSFWYIMDVYIIHIMLTTKYQTKHYSNYGFYPFFFFSSNLLTILYRLQKWEYILDSS